MFQRNSMLAGLAQFAPDSDDVLIVSDVDEILRWRTVGGGAVL